MSKKNYRFDSLFPRTSFLIGAGSVFNLAGNYFQFNTSVNDEKADFKAIESDWGSIGKDLSDIVLKDVKDKELVNNY